MTGLDDIQAGRERAVRDLALKYRGAYPKEKQLARGERRYRRKVASPKQWAAIRAEKLDGRACRFLEVLPEFPRMVEPPPAEELHHLVPRSMGGDDVADNLVGLCRACHKGVTERDPLCLTGLAESLTDAEYAYVVGKLGEGAMGRLFGV